MRVGVVVKRRCRRKSQTIQANLPIRKRIIIKSSKRIQNRQLYHAIQILKTQSIKSAQAQVCIRNQWLTLTRERSSRLTLQYPKLVRENQLSKKRHQSLSSSQHRKHSNKNSNKTDRQRKISNLLSPNLKVTITFISRTTSPVQSTQTPSPKPISISNDRHLSTIISPQQRLAERPNISRPYIKITLVPQARQMLTVKIILRL